MTDSQYQQTAVLQGYSTPRPMITACPSTPLAASNSSLPASRCARLCIHCWLASARADCAVSSSIMVPTPWSYRFWADSIATCALSSRTIQNQLRILVNYTNHFRSIVIAADAAGIVIAAAVVAAIAVMTISIVTIDTIPSAVVDHLLLGVAEII